jgi:hypothetical protein
MVWEDDSRSRSRIAHLDAEAHLKSSAAAPVVWTD